MGRAIRKLLIANRGEIACRIARAAREAGIQSLSLFTDKEVDFPQRTLADESADLGDGSLKDTYLNPDRLIAIARQYGCDAVHPGYGFLSENAQFAAACEKAGLVFIGPSAQAIAAMGDKRAAKMMAEKAGVPMFAPLVGTTSFRTNHNRYLFHVRASYEAELRKIVGHLATLGIHNIAVIYQNSAFGKSNLDTCLQIAQGLKVKVVESVPMEIAATDAKAQVASLTKAQPGAVVMIMAGKMVEVFLRDYRAGGGASPLYTISVGITDAPGSAQRLNGGIEGLVTASIVPSPQASRLPIVADYRKDRVDAGEKIDSYTMLEGYIAARVFVEGLKRAGKALTREGFIKAMEDMGTTKIGDFPLQYGPGNHNGSNFVDLEMYTRTGSLRR